MLYISLSFLYNRLKLINFIVFQEDNVSYTITDLTKSTNNGSWCPDSNKIPEKKAQIMNATVKSLKIDGYALYRADYFELGFQQVYSHILKLDPTANFAKFRYSVVVNANIIKIPNHRLKIHEAAIKSSLIGTNDHLGRFLFITEDNAHAIHFDLNPKLENSYSLMIIFRNGNCQISYYLSRNQGSRYTRKINGFSFGFDLIARLVTNLDSFLAVRPEYDDCSTKKCHRRYSATNFSELRECFLKYIQVTRNMKL